VTASRPYSDYHTPDNEWLGAAPSHWIVTRFGFEMKIGGGQVDPREEPWANTVLVAPNHVEAGTGRLLGRETAAEQGADSGKYVVSSGQIIYSKIRPALNKVAIAVEDCLCSADMYPISPLNGTDVRFAAYYMRSRPFHDYASVMSGRVKMPKVNREELSSAPWLRPPIAEQRAIANFLDVETSRIDELVLKQLLLIEKLSERRTAVIRHTIRGAGLDYAADKLGRWTRIGNGSTPKRDQPQFWAGGDYPWLNSSVVNRDCVLAADEFVTRVARAECHLPTVPPGSVLVGLTGEGRTRGMATLLAIEATINQHIAYVTPNPEHWHSEYLLWLLRASYDDLRAMSEGSTKGGLTCDDLKRVRFPKPPVAEQRRIANHLYEQVTGIDRLVARAGAFIVLAKERRAAIITAATTGQIDVRGDFAETGARV